MKKILLIDPIYNPGTIPPNVPLSKLASGLMQCGYEISVIDFVEPSCEGKKYDYFLDKEQNFINEIKKEASDVDCVYITSGTGNELKPYPIFPRIRKICEAIKKEKNIMIIVGGALINLYSIVYKLSKEDICRTFIDELIIGNEYYGTMNFLCEKPWPKSVVPSWDIWDMNKYPFYKSVQYNVGCPYSCDFCFEGKIYSPKSNLCTLDDFTKSISYGEKIVIEDSVLMSYQNFDDIMTNIGAKNVRFAAYARISEIIKNPDKVKRMKEAGCEALIIGIETLDSSMLKSHNKEIVSYQTRLGLDILKNNDMKVQGCFMLGFPKDSMENMERTIRFAIDEKLNGYRWHIYQPNYSNLGELLRINGGKINVNEHFNVQLNVPDNCLNEIMLLQPELGKLDEHFMIRGKEYISEQVFENIGYLNSFTYKDIKKLIDEMFPKEWILNEEILYEYLFK